MSQKPLHPHPLTRDGLRRDERFPRALSPEYAAVDDRDFSALVHFAYRFASGVRFVEESDVEELETKGFSNCPPRNSTSNPWKDLFDVEDGSFTTEPPWTVSKPWSDLFDGNATIAAARIAEASATDVSTRIERGARRLEMLSTVPDARRQVLVELVEAVLAEFLRIESWRKWIPETFSLGREVRRTIGNTLAAESQTFANLVAEALPFDSTQLLDRLSGLGTSWSLTIPTVAEDAEPSETDVFLRDLDAVASTLRDAVHYLSETARSQLRDILAKEEHAPHLALFFTFLDLFQENQAQLNGLSARHLDFYLRDTLRLPCASTMPDRAIMTFELAKHRDSLKLDEGTAFKAGKDPAGNPLFYEVGETTILNRARVASLKAVRRVVTGRRPKILAAPMADSSDGEGAPLDEEKPWWKPFGRSDNRAATLGFAITSPALRQVGGNKTFTLKVGLRAKLGRIPVSVIARATSIYFTAEKGWETAVVSTRREGSKLVYTITVSADQAVVDHDAEAHGTGFPSGEPIIRVELDQSKFTWIYGVLSRFRITSVDLDVDVTGDSQLILHNDAGAQDPSKPVLPFGAVAEAGSRFTIGSHSVFQKQLDLLKIHLEWSDPPADPYAHYSGYSDTEKQPEFHVAPSLLEGGRWRPLNVETRNLFNSKPKGGREWEPTPHVMTFSAEQLQIEDGDVIPADPEMAKFDAPSADAVRGFLRLELVSPSFGFGARKYSELYTKWVIAYAAAANKEPAGDAGDPPNAPYVPTLASVSLDYQCSASLDEDDVRFLHIGPFGNWDPGTQPTLLPRYDEAGALYVGFEELSPQQTVSLLFQVVDGTEDPFAKRREITWSYLTESGWSALPERALVRDDTRGLRRSGVVHVTLPGDAVTGGTRIPGDQHWLRLTIPAEPDAVPDLAMVVAQAAEVVFSDRGNDLRHLDSKKEPGTIAKLEVKNAALKTIAQPFSSHGGRGPELARNFRLRSTERLRHRDRASTLWDYERLVLNAFPSLHKVKCINHTSECCELAPGSVLVITVPETFRSNAFDRFRPAATQAVLDEVDEFLRKRVSPSVNLFVKNPLYERVLVKVGVVLHSDFDPHYYKLQLEQDIQRFLAPWAFGEADIPFQGTVHESHILNFIEEREYVDYVTSFEVQHTAEGEHVALVDGELRATTERSILVPEAPQEVEIVERSSGEAVL